MRICWLCFNTGGEKAGHEAKICLYEMSIKIFEQIYPTKMNCEALIRAKINNK